MERLTELVSETTCLFAKNFPVAYRDSVIENVKEEVSILLATNFEPYKISLNDIRLVYYFLLVNACLS